MRRAFFLVLRARAVDSDVPVANLHSHKYLTFPESLNIKRQRNSFGIFFFSLSLVDLIQLIEIITCPEAVVHSTGF